MKVLSNINLVICSYGGRNRWDETLLSDRTNLIRNGIGIGPTSYLKKQIKSLNNLKHRIRQVTFIINAIPSGIEVHYGYEDAVKEIPKLLKNGFTKVEVHRRPDNIHCSLGAFSFAVRIYNNKFEYYYFLEDDGIFVEDNFDKILIDQLNNCPGCEFIATYRNGSLFCSSGLMHSKALERVGWNIPCGKYKEIIDRKIYVPPENLNFIKANTPQASFLSPFKICSLKEPYGICPYLGYSQKYKEKMIFHLPGKGTKYLLVPMQMVKEDTLSVVEPKFRIDGYF